MRDQTLAVAEPVAESAVASSAASVAPRSGRDHPQAHLRTVIAEVVYDELAGTAGGPSVRRLHPGAVIAELGIEATDFLDVIARLEGRYQMRFHESWLHSIRTCGDLIDCIARRMFDAADRAAAADLASSDGGEIGRAHV